MRHRHVRRRPGLGALAMVLALPLASCSPERLPTAPVVDVAPQARTPEGALRLLEWAWNRRDLERYRELFTDDFVFVFSLLDAYGNTYRGIPWTREDEQISATHLFEGGGVLPPPDNLTLAFDRNFRVSDDPRPGKAAEWHKTIRTGVSLTIVGPDQETQVTGFANFFLVRGDSALIPRELVERGFGPDSTRWYIQRWEDDTGCASGLKALPTKCVTWGQVKALYR